MQCPLVTVWLLGVSVLCTVLWWCYCYLLPPPSCAVESWWRRYSNKCGKKNTKARWEKMRMRRPLDNTQEWLGFCAGFQGLLLASLCWPWLAAAASLQMDEINMSYSMCPQLHTQAFWIHLPVAYVFSVAFSLSNWMGMDGLDEDTHTSPRPNAHQGGCLRSKCLCWSIKQGATQNRSMKASSETKQLEMV